MKGLRVGLTGSIGSGKSTVAARLRNLGAHVLDADKAARDLLGYKGKAVELVVERFGKEILREDGSIDRKALAKTVFSDTSARNDLNAILHPLVFEALEHEYACIRRKDALSPVFFDVPLLYETGYEKRMDLSVVVCADRKTIIRRTMIRDGVSEEEVVRRLDAQMDQQEKIIRADYVILNDGTIDELFRKVDRLYESIINDA